MTPTSKEDLCKEYLDNYNDINRFDFCKLVLSKYRFENYKLSEHNIKKNDYIIQDDIRFNIQQIINKEECSEDDFKKIFNMLSIEQITYIGF